MFIHHALLRAADNGLRSAQHSRPNRKYRSQSFFTLDVQDTHTGFRRTRKKAKELLPFRLGNKSAYPVRLLISIGAVLITSLIAVVTVNRTNTRCVFIPIVVSNDTYICWCSVSVLVLVSVHVSLNWSVAAPSPSEPNYREQ
jgi:hypothetical protein